MSHMSSWDSAHRKDIKDTNDCLVVFCKCGLNVCLVAVQSLKINVNVVVMDVMACEKKYWKDQRLNDYGFIDFWSPKILKIRRMKKRGGSHGHRFSLTWSIHTCFLRAQLVRNPSSSPSSNGVDLETEMNNICNSCRVCRARNCETNNTCILLVSYP